ncbi:MAG: hypothetical protein FWC96_03415 [Oscillospiraceae bacterium]|nr:hypothetical protein [Oscillospiraceae bacterium]
MTKFVIFSATLLALGTADIASMRRERLGRELIPYILIAIAAGVLALMVFADSQSLIGHMIHGV